MDVVIREATVADAGILAQLSAFVQALHVPLKPQFFRPVDKPGIAEWFAARLSERAVRIWLAEVGGAPMGYAVVAGRERPETPFSVATRTQEIEQLGIHPDVRRHGIGRALVHRVLDEARADGISEVTLTSWVRNEGAQQAFRRMGFTPEIVRFSIAC
jgi:GNAT superfamily N-acetyltransferase